MNGSVEYYLNKASESEIAEYLLCCDADFVPPLSGRVKIKHYAQKIVSKAMRFEAWADCALVGFGAGYCNDLKTRTAYITSVSVLKELIGKGIATRLMDQCVEHAKGSGMRLISLEVASDNTSAIRLYEKSGFVVGNANGAFVGMNLVLKTGEEHEQHA